MPHDLTATGIGVKNRLSSADSWLILVEMTHPDIAPSVYRWSSDVDLTIWTGHGIFLPIAMTFGDVQESVQGGLPRIDMRLSNLNDEFNAAMNANGGLRGAAVTVYVIPSGSLPTGEAELTEVFEVIETSADNQWVTFTLGYADPLGRRFPRDRYTASGCRHIFSSPSDVPRKGPFCRYPGSLLTCDHTLAHCEARNNTAQFGGSPGVNEGVYQ